jgi:hypothetical protein
MKSVPHIICKTCGGKRGFADEHDARKALGRAKAKRARVRGAEIETRVYMCDADVWHLTSQSRRTFQSHRGELSWAG